MHNTERLLFTTVNSSRSAKFAERSMTLGLEPTFAARGARARRNARLAAVL